MALSPALRGHWGIAMKCLTCGLENQDAYVYCQRCGTILGKPLSVSESVLREPKNAVLEAIRLRATTDYTISPFIVLVPILISLVITGLVMFAMIANMSQYDYAPTFEESIDSMRTMLIVLFGGAMVSELVFAFIAFKLVKRQNDHYARERLLRESLMRLVSAATGNPERQQLVVGDLYAMSMTNQFVEKRRNPWFWALCVGGLPIMTFSLVLLLFLSDFTAWGTAMLVGLLLLSGTFGFANLILTLYMFYFLGKSMHEHDGRWNAFILPARTALSKLGFPQGRPFRIHNLQERSFAVYLIVTLFISIFLYYWWYALVKDPNEHFAYQWEFEDNIAESIGR